MEKKENTGTKLNVLLCNLVDYVRGDDRPLVFAVMQEITEYFEQELDKAREEGREESKREYAQAIATGQKVELTEELVDRIWSANLEEMYKMGLTKLLKTKEYGK